MDLEIDVVVIISADIEWEAVRRLFPKITIGKSPYGEYFHYPSELLASNHKTVVFQGGWGKISAAASTQYVIDQWAPKLLVNLGTCGGFEGKIERGTILLVEKTVVYDIFEQMGDPDSHIAHYSTNLDLSWLKEPYPINVRKALLVSGDRDLDPTEINQLNSKYGAIAGDWESGSIAYVATLNDTPCLILRGVSDLVSYSEGEVYGEIALFKETAVPIMNQLMKSLPLWIENADVFID
jgi:adenosylhomocysteine nucleosidase